MFKQLFIYFNWRCSIVMCIILLQTLTVSMHLNKITSRSNLILNQFCWKLSLAAIGVDGNQDFPLRLFILSIDTKFTEAVFFSHV